MTELVARGLNWWQRAYRWLRGSSFNAQTLLIKGVKDKLGTPIYNFLGACYQQRGAGAHRVEYVLPSAWSASLSTLLSYPGGYQYPKTGLPRRAISSDFGFFSR